MDKEQEYLIKFAESYNTKFKPIEWEIMDDYKQDYLTYADIIDGDRLFWDYLEYDNNNPDKPDVSSILELLYKLSKLNSNCELVVRINRMDFGNKILNDVNRWINLFIFL